MQTMQTQFQFLNAGCGLMDGTPWSKAEILTDEQFDVRTDDGRLDKGVKPVKISVNTDNNNELGKRLNRLDYPIKLNVTVSTTVKAGALVMKLIDFSEPK